MNKNCVKQDEEKEARYHTIGDNNRVILDPSKKIVINLL